MSDLEDFVRRCRLGPHGDEMPEPLPERAPPTWYRILAARAPASEPLGPLSAPSQVDV